MKYFIDTEFIEGTQKESFPINLFRKNSKPTIDLISIGIVAEDGREYYAISKDFNLKEAWDRFDWKRKKVNDGIAGAYKDYWLRNNVLKPIWEELVSKDVEWYKEMWRKIPSYGSYHPKDHYFTYKNLKRLLNKYGKTNKEIAEEIKEFCKKDYLYQNADTTTQWKDRGNPEFYGYYADYDWVAFCWLFGNMIDLPKGFPMYCIDLKQLMDEKADTFYAHLRDDSSIRGKLGPEFSLKRKLEIMKGCNNYPKQTNEHNALADAKWNKALYEFLNSLK